MRPVLVRPASVRPMKSSAQAVGAALPTVTRKAFERHGFPAAALIMDWHLIVGAEFAGFTAPEKLKWPRRRPDPESDAAPDPNCKQAGACLTIRVDGARALELQHRMRELSERINTHFGYRAVTDVRILQAPVGRPTNGSARPVPGASLKNDSKRHASTLVLEERPETVAPHASGTTTASVPQGTAATPDGGLESALARLQTEIRSRAAKSK